MSTTAVSQKIPNTIRRPKIGENVFIHPSAVVLGQVTLKDYSSVWPGCVLRGDINKISIGRYTNIQDLSVIHLESEMGCFVGDYCVVGHRVTLHACTLGDGVLVGMGATILNGAKIGDGSLIGAGALVTEGTRVKPGSLYLGMPAKFVRSLTKAEQKATVQWAKKYERLARAHEAGLFLNA